MMINRLVSGILTALIAATAQASELEAKGEGHELIWSLVDGLVAIAEEGRMESATLRLRKDCIKAEELVAQFPEAVYRPLSQEKDVEWVPWFPRADNKPLPKLSERVGVPARYSFVRGKESDGQVIVRFFPSDEGQACIAAISVVGRPPLRYPTPWMEAPVRIPAYPWRSAD